ncbi:MAG: bifunctional 4-hydroxy-3-methylbut-2-enyl diphosphate reductase/30S ribosomal protein S1 [Bacillota bacterium]|nr:bifunctional 4-hydroxy-3-methylbut-2-enyl diphosphate reductase/30S ribosomal protein S1 [Bacillota bacterium]
MVNISIAEPAGFCVGVKRAMALAQAAAERGGSIYSLGALIHNPQVIAAMKDKITVIDSPLAARGDTLIIRSHGAPPQLLAAAEGRYGEIIDATCPFVRRAQQLAAEYQSAGYQVVIVGDAAHPEVVGIRGWAGQAIVVADAAQAQALPQFPRIAAIAQTTLIAADYAAVCAVLEGKTQQLEIAATICNYTEQNQLATRRLAERVERMVIVGGRNSSNTLKLAQISAAAGADVFHIETAAEVDEYIVRGVSNIGVSAGASTPEVIIEEVVEKMSELEVLQDTAAEEQNAEQQNAVAENAIVEDSDNEKISEPEQVLDPKAAPDAGEAIDSSPVEDIAAPEQPVSEDAAEQPVSEDAAAEQPKAAEPDAFTAEYGDMKEIRRGARVKGVIVQVKDDELLVDIGGKSEGVLTSSELTTEEAKDIKGHFNVGDEIDVLILRRENQEGYPVLSKRRVDQDIVWDKLAQLKADKEIVTGKVTDVVKGGVLVDVGIRGFVPASLVSMGFVEDLSTFVGQELQLKIIECDKHANKLVLSAKAVLRGQSKEQKAKTLAEIAEGQTRKGVVRRLTNFGAFVDIGGVDGLLHVSEMAWYRVNHPSDLLKEGDEIEVYILGVNQESEKISLGLKQLIPNPWTLVAEKYPEGSILTAKVMRTTTFGAFLEVEPGVEGLVHISQMAHHRVDKTEDVVKPGDMVEVKVLSVDPEAKRMSLSIKAVLPEPEPEEAPAEQAAEQAVEEAAEEVAETGVAAIVAEGKEKAAEIIAEGKELFEEGKSEFAEKVEEAKSEFAEAFAAAEAKAIEKIEEGKVKAGVKSAKAKAKAADKAEELKEDLSELKEEAKEELAEAVEEAKEAFAELKEKIADKLSDKDE